MAEDVLSVMMVAAVDSDQRYAELAAGWMESALTEALPELRERLEQAPPPNRAALRDLTAPWGEPHALWGGLIVRRSATAKGGVSLYSTAAWRKFLDATGRAPHSAEMEMWQLDAAGRPAAAMARIGAYRFRWDPQWAEFSVSVTRPLLDWDGSAELQERWVAFAAHQAESQRSTFGNIADDNVLSDTALETVLGYSAVDTVPQSGQVLRGYSWVTICGKEVADRLGGAEALGRTGAFHEIRQLTYGGLLLRATPTYAEYDAAAVRRVFEALAPALLTGRSKRIRDYDHLKLVYDADAAEFSRPS